MLGPMFWGSIPHRLGALALRLGRVDDAVAHLSRAVRELDAIAALTWAARARIDLARALDAAAEPGAAHRERTLARDTMRTLGMTRGLAELEAALAELEPTAWSLLHDGADWVLDTGAEHARLHGGRGLEQLRTLLANPAREIAAFTLDAADGAPAPDGGLEVLDERAAATYRRRLAEIGAELDAADRRGDASAAASLEQEREALLAELRAASGFGRATPYDERCRGAGPCECDPQPQASDRADQPRRASRRRASRRLRAYRVGVPVRPGSRRSVAVAVVTAYPLREMEPPGSPRSATPRLLLGLAAPVLAVGVLVGFAVQSGHDSQHKDAPPVAAVPAGVTPSTAPSTPPPIARSAHEFVRAATPTDFTLTGRLFTIKAHVCPMANIRPYDPPGDEHHTVCWVKSGFGVAPSSRQPATTYLFGHSWAQDSQEVLNKMSSLATSELLRASPDTVDGVPVYPVQRLVGYRLILRTGQGTLTYRVRSAWGVRKNQLGFITS